MNRIVLLVLSSLGFLGMGSARAEVKVSAEGSESIRFDIDGKLFTRLHIGPKVAKPYLWPIISSEGVPLTRAWPMEPVKPGSAEKTTDHKHQKSAWFCHGDVRAEGIETPKKKGIDGVDFWSEDGPHGKIKVTSFSIQNDDSSLEQRRSRFLGFKRRFHGKYPENSVKVQSDSATLEMDWLSADGKKILGETRTYRILEGKDGQRLIVMDTILKAGDNNITFEDTKEGAFGIRVRDVMAESKGKGKLTSSEGKTREPNIWGRLLDWVDYSGEVDGKEAGLTVMADPKNSLKTCWHARALSLIHI